MVQMGFLYGLLRPGKKNWMYANEGSKVSKNAPHELELDLFDTDLDGIQKAYIDRESQLNYD